MTYFPILSEFYRNLEEVFPESITRIVRKKCKSFKSDLFLYQFQLPKGFEYFRILKCCTNTHIKFWKQEPNKIYR